MREFYPSALWPRLHCLQIHFRDDIYPFKADDSVCLTCQLGFTGRLIGVVSDDLQVVIGSANLNDRSMKGDGDSVSIRIALALILSLYAGNRCRGRRHGSD